MRRNLVNATFGMRFPNVGREVRLLRVGVLAKALVGGETLFRTTPGASEEMFADDGADQRGSRRYEGSSADVSSLRPGPTVPPALRSTTGCLRIIRPASSRKPSRGSGPWRRFTPRTRAQTVPHPVASTGVVYATTV